MLRHRSGAPTRVPHSYIELLACLASSSQVLSLMPRFRMVSVKPGWFTPVEERTDSSSGGDTFDRPVVMWDAVDG